MTPQKMLEDLKSGALRLVPGEATDAMCDAAHELVERRNGTWGWEKQVKSPGDMWRGMLAASPDLGPALVEMIEGLVRERDEALAERDGALKLYLDGTMARRALAAEAERDALREALAAEREACAAFVEAEAKHLPGGVCDMKATCRYLANEIRARALTKEQTDG